MSRLLLTPDQARSIAEAAVAAFPAEACGLLLGAVGGSDYRVVEVRAARNRLGPNTLDRFEVEPDDLFAAHRYARQYGLRVIGHYHSHPNGLALPSPVDAQWAEEIGQVWLIQAVAAGSPGALAGFISVRAGSIHDRFEPLVIAGGGR